MGVLFGFLIVVVCIASVLLNTFLQRELIEQHEWSKVDGLGSLFILYMAGPLATLFLMGACLYHKGKDAWADSNITVRLSTAGETLLAFINNEIHEIDVEEDDDG